MNNIKDSRNKYTRKTKEGGIGKKMKGGNAKGRSGDNDQGRQENF